MLNPTPRPLALAATAAAAVLLLGSDLASAQSTATITPETAPETSEEGQTGTNSCGTGSSQTSECQNVFVNSATDFCLWAPPDDTSPYGASTIGNTERLEVAWCTLPTHGTRLIPAGALSGVHFVQTEHYVQITGVGDFTSMNVPAGDDGGELDPHGADGLGNPIGGLVFASAFGDTNVAEWTSFMSANYFCIRACTGDRAAEYCEHIYDTLGCGWNIPGDYSGGSFDQCEGEAVEPMGVYGTSTFYQGQASTPAAHPAGATSACTSFATVGGADAGATGAAGLPTQGAVSDASSQSPSLSASTRSPTGSADASSVAPTSSAPSASASSSASSSAAPSSSTSSATPPSSSASASASSLSSIRSSTPSSLSSSTADSAAAAASSSPVSAARTAFALPGVGPALAVVLASAVGVLLV